jgi:hypothetical protein
VKTEPAKVEEPVAPVAEPVVEATRKLPKSQNSVLEY